MKWLFFRIYKYVETLYITISFYIYLLQVNFYFLSFLKLFIILFGLYKFYVIYILALWSNNFYLIEFTFISIFYTFIFEFLMNKNFIHSKIVHIFKFPVICISFFYLSILYSIRPIWCVCILLNISINFVCSSLLRSLIIYPNIFSISVSRYIFVYKLFIFFISYIFSIFLYLLSFYHILTIVDTIISYLNQIISILF